MKGLEYISILVEVIHSTTIATIGADGHPQTRVIDMMLYDDIPTGIKDLLASREIENIFENSDFILMLNQAAGDRQILAKQLNISPYQLSYVTNSGEGEGLLFYGSTIIPFKDKFDKTLKLYSLMTTKPEEVEARKQKEMEE